MDRTEIIAVAFDPAEIEALPRHVRMPGSTIVPHSIDSLRSLDWTRGTPPNFVISPLVTSLFDAQELAGILAAKGFRGRYIAIANSVTAPSVIRNDVARVAPSLHFDVLTLDGSRLLREV